MNIRYISISGNTRSFVQRLTTYSEEQHQHNEKILRLLSKKFRKFSVRSRNRTIFTFVPTYLDGGDGINNGNTEILTEVMREYLFLKIIIVIALAWWAAAIKTLTTNTA